MKDSSLLDTGLRVTITDAEGEVYMGPGPVMVDQSNNFVVIDDEDEPWPIPSLLRDGRAWINGKRLRQSHLDD